MFTNLANGVTLLKTEVSVFKETDKESELSGLDPCLPEAQRWAKITINLDIVKFNYWREPTHLRQGTYVESEDYNFILNIPFEEFDVAYSGWIQEQTVHFPIRN